MRNLIFGLVAGTVLSVFSAASSAQLLSAADNYSPRQEILIEAQKDIYTDAESRKLFQATAIEMFLTNEINEDEYINELNTWFDAEIKNRIKKDYQIISSGLCPYELPICVTIMVSSMGDYADEYVCSGFFEIECPENCFFECGFQYSTDMLVYLSDRYYEDIIVESGCDVWMHFYPNCDPFKRCLELNSDPDAWCASFADDPIIIAMWTDFLACLDGCCCITANPAN